MTTATVTIEARTWTEERIAETDASHAVSRVVFTTEWSGDVVGSSTCGLMIDYVDGDPEHPETLSGPYVGYEQVTGTLEGRTGSFVLAARGSHGEGAARTDVEVVPDSATGDLAGLRGSGSYAATAMAYTLTFDYDFG